MAYDNPTIEEFKEYFNRDFPYGTDMETQVLDSDIGKAYGETNFNINPALFSNQGNYTLGYLLLSAHYLVINLRSSSQGLSGQFSWLQSSKSVGSVSESFAIPERILENPYFSMLTKTNYGARFLELVLPQLSAPMMVAYGRTLP